MILHNYEESTSQLKTDTEKHDMEILQQINTICETSLNMTDIKTLRLGKRTEDKKRSILLTFNDEKSTRNFSENYTCKKKTRV